MTLRDGVVRLALGQNEEDDADAAPLVLVGLAVGIAVVAGPGLHI